MKRPRWMRRRARAMIRGEPLAPLTTAQRAIGRQIVNLAAQQSRASLRAAPPDHHYIPPRYSREWYLYKAATDPDKDWKARWRRAAENAPTTVELKFKLLVRVKETVDHE